MTRKTFTPLASLAAFLLVACSGGDAPSETRTKTVPEPAPIVASDMNAPDLADLIIEDGATLETLLSSVTSEESAQAARPQIEAMIARYTQVADQFQSMGEPSFSEMAALASRLPRLAETQSKLAGEIQRIYQDHPDAADVLRDALGDAGNIQVQP
jgi:hypothetical protein